MNGIVIIDKPSGFTSQDVVSKVKKILNIKKAGHIGTLDPLATGVFPVLIGNATSVSKYLINHDKTYIAKLKFGEKRSTGDLEGEVIEKSLVKVLDEDKIKLVLKSFLGMQIQIPPIYSAIKVNGKKLYEYARNGEEVKVPEREIEIYDIKLLNFWNDEQEIEFEVSCSKGTYIRTLCEDIAHKLGTVGFMSSLRRTRVGDFKITDSVMLEDVDFKHVISIEKIFQKQEKIILNENKEKMFLNGTQLTFKLEDGLYNIYSKDETYIGLGVIKNELLKRDIVIKTK